MEHVPAALVVATAFLLGGCAVVSPPMQPTAAPTVSAGSPGPSLPNGVAAATAVPTAVPNDPAARPSVKITKCAAAGDGWSAGGPASNKATHAKTYKITVFFTSEAATVLHTDSTTVRVKPGAKADWTISAKFGAPKGTLCVLRGVA